MDATKVLKDALDWAGIDYAVRQTEDGGQTQVTIRTADAHRLADLIVTGSRHERADA